MILYDLTTIANTCQQLHYYKGTLANVSSFAAVDLFWASSKLTKMSFCHPENILGLTLLVPSTPEVRQYGQVWKTLPSERAEAKITPETILLMLKG